MNPDTIREFLRRQPFEPLQAARGQAGQARRLPHGGYMPPAIVSTWPVMKPARGLERKSIAPTV